MEIFQFLDFRLKIEKLTQGRGTLFIINERNWTGN
jgi:hypothetical protein